MGATQTHPTPTSQIQINLIDSNCSEQAQFCVYLISVYIEYILI